VPVNASGIFHVNILHSALGQGGKNQSSQFSAANLSPLFDIQAVYPENVRHSGNWWMHARGDSNTASLDPFHIFTNYLNALHFLGIQPAC
jgi:hypothetical protein